MRIFITGGAGFIGCNSADYFLRQGHEVVLYDNLSRAGSQANLDWLWASHGRGQLQIVRADVRDYDMLCASIAGADAVLHLAGQVAVTLSVQDPRQDFEINAQGTFNLLEAVRHQAPGAAVLYASTNKVYGGMEQVRIVEEETRYAYRDYPAGIPETFPLEFHSPYGCSKGAGDQYVLDYARIYGLRAISLRQSCIYGQRQFGVEDQGWVAHFIIAAVKRQALSIYGDGKQVRDVLHISDLIQAYELAVEKSEALKGNAYNIGGGPKNTLSIWREFGPLIESLVERPVTVTPGPWRPGDQKVFVSDIRKAHEQLGWSPRVAPQTGIKELFNWVRDNRELF